MDGLSYFDPERMANRILGMGDIVSLVEKAEELISEKEANELAKKMEKGKFDLDDFKTNKNDEKTRLYRRDIETNSWS